MVNRLLVVRRVIATTLLAAAFAAAPAFAQAPVTPAAGSMTLQPVDSSNTPVTVTFQGARLRVLGVVKPYIANQSVTVRFYRGGKLLGVRYAPVVSAGHNTGHFVAGLPINAAIGTAITIKAIHYRTDLQDEFTAPSQRIKVIPGYAAFGSTGPAVRYLQHALAGLHYAVPLSGVMDAGTARAVEAFRKMTDMARTQEANQAVFAALARGEGAFQVRYPGQGDHFEGDLTHQVLAEVMPHGQVRQIYNISSGKPSTPTVIGTFYVYRKEFGTSSDGMVDSSYFISGYAIHGYADVPNYPASHGCMRIPIPDALSVYNWSRIGDPVDVYYRSGGGSHHVSRNAGP
jgi:hypothetical protein